MTYLQIIVCHITDVLSYCEEEQEHTRKRRDEAEPHNSLSV